VYHMVMFGVEDGMCYDGAIDVCLYVYYWCASLHVVNCDVELYVIHPNYM
jgi:hypothetical protein